MCMKRRTFEDTSITAMGMQIMSTTTLIAVSNEMLMLLGGVILLAATILTIVLHRKRNSVWRQFALRHGLKVTQGKGGRHISGDVNGHRITLETVDESSDTGPLGVAEIRMSVKVDCQTWPVGLRIESATNSIGDLEAHNTVTGNEVFDRALLVLGRDRTAACGWLTDDRQTALMELAVEHNDKRLKLAGDQLALQTRNAISRLQELDDMLRSLIRTASIIEFRDDESHRGLDELNALTTTRENPCATH